MWGVHALNMTYDGPVTPPGCISVPLLVTAGMSLLWKKQLFEFNVYLCLNVVEWFKCGVLHEIEEIS